MTGAASWKVRSAILVAVAVAAAAPAAGAAAPARATPCAAGVTIAGKTTCLAPGKACRAKYASTYASKGFTCKRDAKGRHRLKRMKQVF